MIYGVGTDIIKIDRVRSAIEKREHFLNRFYSEAEQQMFHGRKKDIAHLAAACFVGKEAVAKAFGTGFCAGVRSEEIEILRKESGAPYVHLLGETYQTACRKGIQTIHISLSDTETEAVAFAVAERE